MTTMPSALNWCAGCLLIFGLWLLVGVPGVSAQDASFTVVSKDGALEDVLRAVPQVLNVDEAETPSGDIVSIAQSDYGRLLSALYKEGYFAPTISIQLNGREASDLSVFRAPATVLPARIRIDAGLRFTFGVAQIAPLPAGVSPPSDFTSGGVAKTGIVLQAANEAVTAWRSASHARAEIQSQQITANHAQSRLNVHLLVSPGPPLTFGELTVSSDSAVRPNRIRAIARLPKGDAFDPAALDRVRERLVRTGVFRSVVLTEDDVTAGALNIGLETEDATPRRFGFGAEIASSEGLSLEAFWFHRNIFGGAERLRFDAEIGGIDGEMDNLDGLLSASLSIPAFRQPDDTLILTARAERLNEPAYESRVFELFATRERMSGQDVTYSIGAGLRTSKITDVFGTRSFDHVLLDWSATLDRRDDALAATRGYFVDASFEPFFGLNGSQNGLRLSGDARGYYSLGENTIFAARAQVGSVLWSDLIATPPDFLFFSGGGGTVRGQAYQTLGVSSANGSIGGRGFFGVSAEMRQSLSENLGMVAFADFGLVSEDPDFTGSDSHSGFGFGVRYRTGLGPIRVDVGFPGDDDITLDAVQLYIGLGESF